MPTPDEDDLLQIKINQMAIEVFGEPMARQAAELLEHVTAEADNWTDALKTLDVARSMLMTYARVIHNRHCSRPN